MSSSREDSITIKLEIHIPTTGGPPTVLFSPQSEERSSGPIVADALIKPAGGQAHTTLNGEICVSGTRNTNTATAACAKVFQGTPSVSGPPPSDATPCTMNPISGEFLALLVPGVTGYPATNLHTAAAWELVGSVYNVNDTQVFRPIWGQFTDCTYPFFSARTGAKPCSSPLTFELLPVRWSVAVKGFAGGELARANGHWTMRLTTAPNQKVLYCNGGDGLSFPRVQLVCESPFAETWQLRFEVCDCRVTYFLMANKFNQQGKNTFGQAEADVPGDDFSIPASVTISPE